MSNYTTVIGKVEVPLWPDEWRAASQVNQRAIEMLPAQDSWPFLGGSMFAVTPASQCYVNQIIHFASSMKGIEEEWAEWLGKFESLLRRMSWLSATVYLQTEHFGSHSYWWVASESTPGCPVATWQSGGGPRSHDEFVAASRASPQS